MLEFDLLWFMILVAFGTMFAYRLICMFKQAKQTREPRECIVVIVVTCVYAILLYGLVVYPDAPIRECASYGYCGKMGQPHTPQDFYNFKVWQTTFECIFAAIFVFWLVGMLYACKDRVAEFRRKRQLNKSIPLEIEERNCEKKASQR